jgi:hypothetical protein
MIKNALPVPVHSHNDYWQKLPLWEALGSGCIGVKADVHLKKSDLRVGHSSLGLNKKNTLRALYLNPLQRIITAQNEDHTGEGEDWKGIFNKAPKQTVVLLIDLKSSAEATFAELNTQLQPLRDMDFLTYWNGTHRIMRPLTIVRQAILSSPPSSTSTPPIATYSSTQNSNNYPAVVTIGQTFTLRSTNTMHQIRTMHPHASPPPEWRSTDSLEEQSKRLQ